MKLTEEKKNSIHIELKKLLKLHFALYPLLTPQDAVKLLYQSEFGCGHFAPDRETVRLMLVRECAAFQRDERHRAFESIGGGGFIRVHLEPLVGNEKALHALGEAFARSACEECGSMEGFFLRLDALESLAKEGGAPFLYEELFEYLEAYKAIGCPAVHHSETYRALYHPAYRVIKKELYANVKRHM